MLIAQISDSHIAVPPAPGGNRSDDLARCVAHLNGLARQPDLVVHTGDITHNGAPAEYAEAARILAALRAPLRVIPGNKDNRAQLRTTFASHISPDCHNRFMQYSWCGGKTRAIMLDTVSTQSNRGRLCPERLDHLAAMLCDAGARPVAVFMHHPPFEIAVAPVPFQFEQRGDLEALSALLHRHGNVRHLYCGHSHRAATGHLDGIAARTIISTALDLRQGPAGHMVDAWPIHTLTA